MVHRHISQRAGHLLILLFIVSGHRLDYRDVEGIASIGQGIDGLQQAAANALPLVRRQHHDLRHAQPRPVRVTVEIVHRAESHLSMHRLPHPLVPRWPFTDRCI